MQFKFSRLRRTAFCAFACCVSAAFADPAPDMNVRVISWDAPVANEDGSPLDDLMGYYVYIGDSPDTMVPYYFITSLQQYMVYQYMSQDTQYLAITAVNVDGTESEMSQMVVL